MSRIKLSAPMSPPWVWAAAGALLGLLLMTLLNLPARWLTAACQEFTQGRLIFKDARGTAWNGSAQLTLAGGAGSTDASTLPGRLAWRIRPAWGAILAEVSADCCMQTPWGVSLLPHWSGATLLLNDSQSQWPAQWLAGLGTPWNTVQLEGTLMLVTQGLSVQWTAGRMSVSGRARLDAERMVSRLSTLRPMGSYRLTLHGGAAPTLALETLEGSLQLSGRGQWAGSRWRFEGDASAAPNRLEALSNLLNIIGQRDGAHAIIKVG